MNNQKNEIRALHFEIAMLELNSEDTTYLKTKLERIQNYGKT